MNPPDPASAPPGTPRDALAEFDAIAAQLAGRRPVLFLDYDGTLAPIAPRPELAVAPERIRALVARLARHIPVAIVSGRALADVADMLGVEGVAYAGSHGFEIRDAAGRDLAGGIGEAFRPALVRARDGLAARLARVPGARVEDKRYAIAVHYRETDPGHHHAIAAHVDEEAKRHAGLKRTGGKMVHELRPDIAWNKGSAVLRLLEALGTGAGGSPADTVPIYIGDDETDEDAFRAIAGTGIGIRVGAPAQTSARYSLRDPDAVAAFLQRLLDLVARDTA